MLVSVRVCVCQLCLTLPNPLDCSPSGSSIHGISQARTLEWVAISSSRESSPGAIKPSSPALQADSLPLSHQRRCLASVHNIQLLRVLGWGNREPHGTEEMIKNIREGNVLELKEGLQRKGFTKQDELNKTIQSETEHTGEISARGPQEILCRGNQQVVCKAGRIKLVSLFHQKCMGLRYRQCSKGRLF